MNKIEQKVMASVAVIFAVRQLTSRLALELYALALSFGAVGFFVSVPHVILNLESTMRGGLPSVAAFTIAAVVGTKLLVQLALILGFAGAVALFSDIVRSAGRASHTALA